MKISIEATVNAPLSDVWSAWITSSDITAWNFATDEWQCPRADINFKVGEKFNYRMEAKDGTAGFDFCGVFTKIIPNKSIHYQLEDNRIVTIDFIETPSGVRVVEGFEAENENAAEQQKQGWQSILNNFKNYVERKMKILNDL